MFFNKETILEKKYGAVGEMIIVLTTIVNLLHFSNKTQSCKFNIFCLNYSAIENDFWIL